MAISEIYVDPSIAADSGTGTIGDPYGDLEYAIKQTTFDTTNGTRVNIKAGTDEVLVASLENALADTGTTAAWAPSETAPCVFQGYTSTAGDGGVGGISGGGSVSVMGGDAFDYIHFIDLELYNTGANDIISLDNFCALIRCELHTTSGIAIDLDTNAYVGSCYVHDCTGTFAVNILGGEAFGNYIDSAATSTVLVPSASYCAKNIVVVRATDADGIRCTDGTVAQDNSIYHIGSGTGSGVFINTAALAVSVRNNVIEGFSGTGGYGIEYHPSGAASSVLTGGNAVYNCTTAYGDPTGFNVFSYGDNETLTASPFTDAENGDFSPVDTGNVREGALPQVIGGGFVGSNALILDKGAVQPAAPAGSGSSMAFIMDLITDAAA